MPNHVMSHLRLSGDQNRINEILESIKGEDTVLDFNKIIPMPESLDIEASSKTDHGLAAYKEFIAVYIFDGSVQKPDLLNIPEKSEQAFLRMRKDIQPDEWELGKTAFQNQIKYGAPTWYEWAIENWGTKWNAYDTDTASDNTIIFQTAWSGAMPVISKLAEMYPEISFEFRWADEDLGSNVGIAEFEGGELVHDEFYEACSREAYELAADLWGLDLEEEGYVFNEEKQTYEYDFSEEQSEDPSMS